MRATAPTALDPGDEGKPATRGDVHTLTNAVQHLADTNRWRKIGRAALAIGLAAVMALAVSNLLLFRRTAGDAACVRDWAVKTTVRTNILVPLSTSRQDALDALIRSLATKDPQARQAGFQAAFAAYLDASNTYSQALHDNPPPAQPAFNC